MQFIKTLLTSKLAPTMMRFLGRNQPEVHPALQRLLLELQERVKGAVHFLEKTTITRNQTTVPLKQLPCYLLVGPTGAGKTALLANAGVPFVLQKQGQAEALKQSIHCDWWATREMSLIDVPGHYLYTHPKAALSPSLPQTTLWHFFLRAIKKWQGLHALTGVVIALPLPELLSQPDDKKYQRIIKNLSVRLLELSTMAARAIPCQLVITKCDLLTGFSDFFAESSEEETKQVWGMSIPQGYTSEQLPTLFVKQFDLLIKKINQQLLWRLHHERDNMRRPFIKEFPLQLEQLKTQLAHFLKKWASQHPRLSLQQLYLTSALQEPPRSNELTLNLVPALRLYEPHFRSQAYFIKHMIAQGFASIKSETSQADASGMVPIIFYTVAIIAVIAAAGFFGRDFFASVKETKAINQDLSAYQTNVIVAKSSAQQLMNTLALLDKLKQVTGVQGKPLFTYYSQAAATQSQLTYKQVLQTLLLPQLQNSFEDYLRLPVNQTGDHLNAVLQAYLMLGNPAQFDPHFFMQTLAFVWGNQFSADQKNLLAIYTQQALKMRSQPLVLNQALIASIHHYFTEILQDPVNLSQVDMMLGMLLNHRSQLLSQSPAALNGLNALHQYLQLVLTSGDEQKAAYQLITNLIQHQDNSDPISQLRLIANNTPAPLNGWLNKIANTTWLYLMQDSMHYLDASWRTDIIAPYESQLVAYYPFNKTATQEVPIAQFTQFFGSNGLLQQYFNQYLAPLVDTSGATWQWKTLANNQTLPLSDDALHQIQEAMHIHDVFFAGSNQLAWQFTLQPYEVNPTYKTVAIAVNGKLFTDDVASAMHSALDEHQVMWPTDRNGVSVVLMRTDQQAVTAQFPGVWGWYKLLTQDFDSASSKQKLMINLSQDGYAAKYLVTTAGANNPFLALDLSQFKLSPQLSEGS